MKKWAKKEKHSFKDPDPDDLGGVYAYGSYIFVYVKPSGKHWDDVDTVIHESVHVYQKAMEYIGEPVTGIESQAYHIAAIATNMLKDFEALKETTEFRI